MKNLIKILSSSLILSLLLTGCSLFPEVRETELKENSYSLSSQDFSEYPYELSSEESSEPESSLKPIDTSVIYDFDHKYFAKQLDESSLRVFTEIYQGALNHTSDIDFDISIPAKDFDTVMYFINYDCPELIHLSGDYYPIYDPSVGNGVSGVQLIYLMSETDYPKNLTAVKKLIAQFKDELEGKSDIEKEKYIYDYIFDNCIYDDTDYLSGSVYGALINHIGRCESFCKSLMWCMREMGIECICVSGTQNWQTNSVFNKHSWNIIKIDGEYYHVDVTLDNFKTSFEEDNPPNYGFFNVDDSFVAGNRMIDNSYISYHIPSCRSTKYNYHILNHLLIKYTENTKESFMTMLQTAINEDSSIGPVSIKFEAKENYEETVENHGEWITEFTHTYTKMEYNYTTYYNELSQTFIIQAEIQQ